MWLPGPLRECISVGMDAGMIIGFGPKSIYLLSGLQQLTRKDSKASFFYLSLYSLSHCIVCIMLSLEIFLHCRSDSAIGSGSYF